MRVDWQTISDNERTSMQAWLICDVEGREDPMMVLYLGSIAAEDIGDASAELTFWIHARSALYPSHLLQPEMKDGALTFHGRPYEPGERDALEQQIAETVATPKDWETTQSWVDQAAERAKQHTYYLPIKRLS
jgi:hypothetical protein